MKVSRRDFVRTVALGGAGLVIGFNGREIFAADAAKGFAPKGWVKGDIESTVRVTIGKSAMGRGVRTLLGVSLAGELHANLARIKMQHAAASPGFDGHG